MAEQSAISRRRQLAARMTVMNWRTGGVGRALLHDALGPGAIEVIGQTERARRSQAECRPVHFMVEVVGTRREIAMIRSAQKPLPGTCGLSGQVRKGNARKPPVRSSVQALKRSTISSSIDGRRASWRCWKPVVGFMDAQPVRRANLVFVVPGSGRSDFRPGTIPPRPHPPEFRVDVRSIRAK